MFLYYIYTQSNVWSKTMNSINLFLLEIQEKREMLYTQVTLDLLCVWIEFEM